MVATLAIAGKKRAQLHLQASWVLQSLYYFCGNVDCCVRPILDRLLKVVSPQLATRIEVDIMTALTIFLSFVLYSPALPSAALAGSPFAGCALAEEDAKSDLERFNGRIPFLISHFVTGYQKELEGCPGVMISKWKARGMVVWSRKTDAAAVKLIDAIEKSGVDGDGDDHVLVYLVGFDTTPQKVSEAVKELKLKHALAGSARPKWEQVEKLYKLDANVETVVFLAEARALKQVWVLKAGELDEKKGKEIEGVAVEFLKLEAGSSGR